MTAGGETWAYPRRAVSVMARPLRKTYAYGFRQRWKIPAGDPMFRWIAPNDYLDVGRSAVMCIVEALGQAEKREIRRILDFGCGYGRVLRFLAKTFPAASITASDTNADYLAYCARVFGATPVRSSNDPRDVTFADTFDLIWAGSVFTHLDSDLWDGWLQVLGGFLVGDGVLVFSTHGPDVEARIRRREIDYGLEPETIDSILRGYQETGFGYGDYPGLGTASFRHLDRYGISVVGPGAVRDFVADAGVQITHYIPTGWGDHQDIYACSPVHRASRGSDEAEARQSKGT